MELVIVEFLPPGALEFWTLTIFLQSAIDNTVVFCKFYKQERYLRYQFKEKIIIIIFLTPILQNENFQGTAKLYK